MSAVRIIQGDCLEVMRGMADNSVDSVVCDPPYGLGQEPDALAMLRDWMTAGHHDPKSKRGFMGKEWDSFVPQPAVWAECFRVLKPGGFLIAFAGARTHDLMTLGIRIAGFEIRDMLAWLYAQGMPKNFNVPAAIKKAAGDEAAQHWTGFGTALKPCVEPLTMARKPLDGTIAQNLLKHGTGALNIDGCRVATDDDLNGGAYSQERQESASPWAASGSLHKSTGKEFVQPTGRWPGNVCHDGSDAVLAAFPQASGAVAPVKGTEPSSKTDNTFGEFAGRAPSDRRDGGGSAARFFFCPKTSAADRHEGLEHPGPQFTRGTTLRDVENAAPELTGNTHVSVKPTALMQWLVRMVTPPGGTVLDPYAGSGSTLKAADLEGFNAIGIEREAEYVAIAAKRVDPSHPLTRDVTVEVAQ